MFEPNSLALPFFELLKSRLSMNCTGMRWLENLVVEHPDINLAGMMAVYAEQKAAGNVDQDWAYAALKASFDFIYPSMKATLLADLGKEKSPYALRRFHLSGAEKALLEAKGGKMPPKKRKK